MQLLKLAALQALPELSEVYVIWDMDMVPTRHIPLVYQPSPASTTMDANLYPDAQLPPDASIMTVRGHPVRTVVNIGGMWNRGYGESYEKLLKRKCGPWNLH